MTREPIHNKPDENPFDVLAEHAENEYRAGRTRSLRDFADENDTPLGERNRIS